MKKFLLLLLSLHTMAAAVLAQAPEKMSYQAVIRNSANMLVSSQNVGMRISLLQGSATGTVVYSETHSSSTNAGGVVSLEIGGGTVVSGSFSGIDWAAGPYFIKTETDPEGGSNYSITGTSQLLSAPYALFSSNGVAKGTQTGQMLYWNGANWIPVNPGTNGQSLTFCNGIPVWGLCPDGLPTISTGSITNGSFAITSGGNISSDGGSDIIARGVCWGINPNPTILNNKTNDGSGIGSYSSSITGLNTNNTYYVRAYATNLAGTAYGNQLSIQTLETGTLNDIDGNIYQTLHFGSQEWMKENLRVSKYRNGDTIPNILSIGDWTNTSGGAFSFYNNDATNNTVYGKLYNGLTVGDQRGLCPAGWHIPNDSEWTILANFLGGFSVSGGKMKSAGTIQGGTGLWSNTSLGATNSSGFTGVPSGYRIGNILSGSGTFGGVGDQCYWWSSSLGGFGFSSFFLESNSIGLGSISLDNYSGFSVRCLKD